MNSSRNFISSNWISFSFLLAILLSVKFSICSYWHPNPVQWVGNFINISNTDKAGFCDKQICIEDASRMGLWINESANPCDNFYRYVCGSFLYYVSKLIEYVPSCFDTWNVISASFERALSISRSPANSLRNYTRTKTKSFIRANKTWRHQTTHCSKIDISKMRQLK